MENILGLVISMIYILFILILGTAVAKYSKGASESSRKLVHILVGNWVFLTPIFTEVYFVILVPFVFIIVNSISYKYKIIKAMERDDDSLGTVYYAISMFLLTGIGFLLNWYIFPFVGLLIMAYGDGLAAVIGKKWGKTKPFSFAPEKSIAGSMTVFLVGILVTSGTIIGSELIQRLPLTPWYLIVFISLLTGSIAVVLELSGKRGSDNLLLPMGTGLFATICYYYGNLGFYIYLFIAALILYFAFHKKSITVDGASFAILTASILYAFGGILLGISLLIFFITGSIVSKIKNNRKEEAERLQENSEARNWVQVICNSLPATILAVIYFFHREQPIYLILAFSVFSAAAADTFSSELGMLYKGKVYHILTGKEIARGLSGGVSLGGFAASILGSALLSIPAFLTFQWVGFFYVLVLGILGGILDSVIGALFQRKYLTKNGTIQEMKTNQDDKLIKGFYLFSNHMVNLLSLTLIPLVGIAVYLLKL